MGCSSGKWTVCRLWTYGCTLGHASGAARYLGLGPGPLPLENHTFKLRKLLMPIPVGAARYLGLGPGPLPLEDHTFKLSKLLMPIPVLVSYAHALHSGNVAYLATGYICIVL